MNNFPFVSIIIPCRNEEKYIAKCLDSIIINDYPKEKLEVLVMNGASEDKTKQIVQTYTERYPFIKLRENPKKFTPFGLNIGLKEAKGGVIMRMDAHAGYERDYISKCMKYLLESNADNVGGIIKTLPAKNTIVAKAIAIALSHFFGVGGSYFRMGSKKPMWTDTVFGGCYKREVFSKVGFFDERLRRSQDIEFNKRLARAGGKILLVPEIKSIYYPQSDFKNFLKHNFNDGIWAIYPLKFGIVFFSLRHLIPLFFISSLIILAILSFFYSIFFKIFLFEIGIYFLANSYFSAKISFKEKDLKYFPLMLIAFTIRHFGYGFGSIWGLIKVCGK